MAVAEAVAETVGAEESGLDDFIKDWEDDQAEVEAEASKVSPEDKEKARKAAAKINSGFLWVVKKTQCPHVRLELLIDEEAGTEAFLPLTEQFGGDVPPWLAVWMEQLQPFIAAGTYMGTAIVTARQAEAQALEMINARKEAENGDTSESRPAE